MSSPPKIGGEDIMFCGRPAIGVDLAGLLGGRMASAEGESVPSGVEYEEGCGRYGFWRILKATECSFLCLYDEI